MDEEVELLHSLSVNRVFTTRDAERAGVPRMRLLTLRREGRLTRLTRGAWTTASPEDPEEQHLLRTVAVIRRHQRDSAATAHSALVLLGLPLVGADLTQVHLVRDVGSRSTRRGKDYTVWGAGAELEEVHREDVLDHPVLSALPATAIVHAGLVNSPHTALVAADAAAARGLVTARQLEVAAARVPRGTAGIAAVRRALADVDGRHESPGETLTARVLRSLGIEFEPQVWIGPWRVDFLITGTTVIVEFDGAVKYRSRADLLAEKRREDDLRRRGHVLVRLMWGDLERPALVRERIDAALRLPAA